MKKGGGGVMSNNVQVILMLSFVAVLLGSNYYRNAQAENEQARTYVDYSDTELQAKIKGVQKDIKVLSEEYKAQEGASVRGRDRGDSIENMKAGQRAVEGAKLLEQIGNRLHEKEELLSEMEAAEALRGENSGGLQVFIRRMTSF